jgi:hypothetical protein
MSFKCFLGVLQVFKTFVTSVSTVFGRMLQVFHLGVSKVDLMLHMLQWYRPEPAVAAG